VAEVEHVGRCGLSALENLEHVLLEHGPGRCEQSGVDVALQRNSPAETTALASPCAGSSSVPPPAAVDC
jgi:hypothetical protein